MATGWVKSLQCKSNAVEDVADHHRYSALPSSNPTKPPPLSSSPSFVARRNDKNHTKKPPLLHPLGCGNTSQALRDVVLFFPKHPISRMPTTSSRKPHHRPPQSPAKKKLTKPKSPHSWPSKPKCPSPKAVRETSSPFPTLSELPTGHSSRRVVEIIFSSSWSGHGEPFSGEIEMLFKVHNPARTVARFEEYRDAIRSRAGPADSRCAADGNEMMRFHCAPAGPSTTPAGEPIYDAGVICCSSPGGGIQTFSGSGGAHESGASGIGRRRAMLVCRVIAGRVRTESEEDFESVSVGKGELSVFDPRAVLPCFLIIYKL